VVTVVTDYVVHAQWIHPGTDLYLVGSENVREGLVERGVPRHKISVTGIPIRANTGLLGQREALKEKWGLKPGIPTVLVMTGAQGMMRRPWPLFHTIASRPVQGFFLCGKDRALMSRLKLWAHRYPEFRIMPFVRIVPELMCVSDVLISKAGGLTTSEALAMELPMIIFHPIPGQEFANRDYLTGSGAAMTADSLRQLGRALDRLCAAPEKLDEMRSSIRQIRRPDAAQHAAREMLDLVNERWRWSRQ
jgi:processive 1,2-diacylglycerol beta-glucosyltransferase